jgi:hypothetical protein
MVDHLIDHDRSIGSIDHPINYGWSSDRHNRSSDRSWYINRIYRSYRSIGWWPIKIDRMIYPSYCSITIDRMIYQSYWLIKVDLMIYWSYWSITIDRMIYRSYWFITIDPIDPSRSINRTDRSSNRLWSIHWIDRSTDRSIESIDHLIDLDRPIGSIDHLIDR